MKTGRAADKVWNRAALEGGGPTPGVGDIHLAALLLVHGLVMNGGVHHALESLGTSDVESAARGFEYFGLLDVSKFLAGCDTNPLLVDWSDQHELEANDRYAELVPDDAFLVAAFEAAFATRQEDFAPVD